jgi:hypothetical protein
VSVAVLRLQEEDDDDCNAKALVVVVAAAVDIAATADAAAMKAVLRSDEDDGGLDNSAIVTDRYSMFGKIVLSISRSAFSAEIAMFSQSMKVMDFESIRLVCIYH